MSITIHNENERNSLNAPVVSMIMGAIEGVHQTERNSGNPIDYRYLLGQIIRQYIIPAQNWHITQAAKAQWEEMTDQNIQDYTYQQHFEAKTDGEIKTYKGTNQTKPTVEKYYKGKKYAFNTFFIVEHTIPVSDIMDALIELKTNDRNNIIKILDKIHHTRMLKSEDRKIKRDRARIREYQKRYPKEIISVANTESALLFKKLSAEFYEKEEIIIKY